MKQEEQMKLRGKAGRQNKKRGNVLKINVWFVKGEKKRKRNGQERSEREQQTNV